MPNNSPEYFSRVFCCVIILRGVVISNPQNFYYFRPSTQRRRNRSTMIMIWRHLLLICAILTAYCDAQSSNSTIQFTSIFNSTVTVGSPVTVTWSGGNSSIYYLFELMKGSPGTYTGYVPMFSTADGNTYSYDWTPCMYYGSSLCGRWCSAANK